MEQPPFQPQQYPIKKSHMKRNVGCGVGIVVLLLVLVIVIVSISQAGKPTGAVVGSTTPSATQQTQTTPAASAFTIGQIVAVGSTWDITVLSAKTSAGSEFNTPQHAGDVFLIFQISVKNISGQSQNMSSDLQWVLQDTTGQKYDSAFDSDAGSTLDGAVGAGRTLKGAVVYEVPKTVTAFTLAFQNDIFSSDQAIWTITV